MKEQEIDLGINPFEGDFGDGETQLSLGVCKPPTCHECNKAIVGGECVRKVDAKIDWDFEQIDELEIFYWHKRCWLKMQKEISE